MFSRAKAEKPAYISDCTLSALRVTAEPAALTSSPAPAMVLQPAKKDAAAMAIKTIYFIMSSLG